MNLCSLGEVPFVILIGGTISLGVLIGIALDKFFISILERFK